MAAASHQFMNARQRSRDKIRLRVLGRGYCFDGVEELCLISAEVLRVFFHKFCKLFSEANFSVYCSPPTSDEDIANKKV